MSGPALADVLSNRRWERRVRPFPHIVARQVFEPAFYRTLDDGLRHILARGVDGPPRRGAFARNMSSYDAYGVPLCEAGEAFRLFRKRPWHDMLASLFSVDATGHVNGGLHHHGATGANGWVHNDLNPGWFAGPAPPDETIVTDRQICDYITGAVSGDGPKPIQVVRAVAMILYLANGPDARGGTGLYALTDQPVQRPSVLVQPEDNSLLAFECTPFSFHAFVAEGGERNSMILWLHRPLDEVVSRWGAGAIRNWTEASP